MDDKKRRRNKHKIIIDCGELFGGKHRVERECMYREPLCKVAREDLSEDRTFEMRPQV